MKSWSIQYRIVLLAVLPATLIAVALIAIEGASRLQAGDADRLADARDLALRMAPAIELALLTDHREGLESLANELIEREPTIVRIELSHANGDRLVERRQLTAAGIGDLQRPEELLWIEQPVHRALSGRLPGPLSLGGTNPAPDGRIIGRIRLAVVHQQPSALPGSALRPGAAIAALMLAFIALIAVRIGRSASAPIHELTRRIERIRRGDLTVQPICASGGELGRMEQAIAFMAQEIRANQTSMRDRIADATAELQHTLMELEARNRELEEARAHAEAVSEFKSRFLASISHEIRTPMNSILGFAELLRDARLSSEQADYVLAIHHSAQSLLDLLNSILDLSKVESGHIELEYADTDLHKLADDLFKMLAPEAFRKGIEFIIVPPRGALRWVRTDPVRLKQILTNLLSNAIKFTDHGHVILTMALEQRANDTTAARFTVQDTGHGIPEKAQARLFEAFAQGSQQGYAPSERIAGTGLGLHIASELVLLMDGVIHFESKPGAGTVFSVKLEFSGAVTADRRAPSEPAQKSRSIVLFEPDEDVRHALAALFDAAGIDCVPIADPAHIDRGQLNADATIQCIHPADLNRGRISSAPAFPGRADIPIIAYCDTHTPGARSLLEQAGFDRVLGKVGEPTHLRMSLDSLLGGVDPRHCLRADDSGISPEPPASSRTATLLVVDDHPLNLKLLTSYFRHTTFTTHTARTATEAVDLAGQSRFDVILMDVHLPDRSGVETIRTIRSHPGPNRDTPVILLTADVLAGNGPEAGTAGALEVLIKPVSRSLLMERVSAVYKDAADRGETDIAGDPPLFDSGDGLRRAGGRQLLATELLQMLRQSLPEARDRISDAMQSGDPVRVRAAAHRLRGAAAYCGVPRLQQRAARVEDVARRPSHAELVSAVDALLATIDDMLMQAEFGS